MSLQCPGLLPVGDTRRPPLGRAAFGTLAASAVFFLFTATKQIAPIYLHAPWVDDPYDTVLSFTMFFVPLLAVTLLVPLSLCKTSEPMPVRRAVTIVRACRVAIGAIAIELVSAWAAVVLRANQPAWTSATTVLVVALVLSSVLTAKVIVDVVRARPIVVRSGAEEGHAPDWLGDLLIVARQQADRVGPLRRLGLAVVAWTDQTVVGTVRRHPLSCAAVGSGAFSVTVFGWQALRERQSLALTGVAMSLGLGGMFAFVVLAGSYLGIVRSPARLDGARRRALDAAVAACIESIAVFAFRDSLWWIIYRNTSTAGPTQLATLLAGFAFVTFAVVVAGETRRGSHSRS